MKNVNTNDWDLKIFGGLNKNQIRQLAKGLFNNDNSIFGTLYDSENIDNNTFILTIELNNASVKSLNNVMGNNYAKVLTLNSYTHEFVFKNYKSNNETVDLHEYEPSKISKGAFTNRSHVYAIIEAKLKL